MMENKKNITFNNKSLLPFNSYLDIIINRKVHVPSYDGGLYFEYS